MEYNLLFGLLLILPCAGGAICDDTADAQADPGGHVRDGRRLPP